MNRKRKAIHLSENVPVTGAVRVTSVSFVSHKKVNPTKRRLAGNVRVNVVVQPPRPEPELPSALDQTNLSFEQEDLHSTAVCEEETEITVTVNPPRKGSSKSVSVSPTLFSMFAPHEHETIDTNGAMDPSQRPIP